MTDGLLVETKYPSGLDSLGDEAANRGMEVFRGLVTAARNIRAQYHINPKTMIELRIKTPEPAPQMLDEMTAGLEQLTRADRLEIGPDVVKDKDAASSPVGELEVIVPLSGIADLDAETKRLEKEKAKIELELSAVDKKLSNDNFVKKARQEVVDKARSKREVLMSELGTIEESLKIIGARAITLRIRSVRCCGPRAKQKG